MVEGGETMRGEINMSENEHKDEFLEENENMEDIDVQTMTRERETFLKGHAEEYLKITLVRRVWVGKLSRFLHMPEKQVQKLVQYKTVKEMNDDYTTLTYYLPGRDSPTWNRKVMDINSSIMMWFALSLGIVTAITLVLKVIGVIP